MKPIKRKHEPEVKQANYDAMVKVSIDDEAWFTQHPERQYHQRTLRREERHLLSIHQQLRLFEPEEHRPEARVLIVQVAPKQWNHFVYLADCGVPLVDDADTPLMALLASMQVRGIDP